MTEDRMRTVADQCSRAAGYCGNELYREIMSLRSRLQALEAENLTLKARTTCDRCGLNIEMSGAANWGDILDQHTEYRASLARVTQLCETPPDEHWSGHMANGWISAMSTIKAALAGGTSPEPSDPPCAHRFNGASSSTCERCGELLANVLVPDAPLVGPVDVASEPPNPPVQLGAGIEGAPIGPQHWSHQENRSGGNIQPMSDPYRQPRPVGEPLKPTEQEQR